MDNESLTVDKENVERLVETIETKSDEQKQCEVKHLTPAQDKLKMECLVLASDIGALEHRKNLGWLGNDMTKEYEEYVDEVAEEFLKNSI